MTMTSSILRSSLDLVEVKPGLKFSKAMLKSMLPDVETALFFGKVYELDYQQLSTLLHTVLDSELANVLFAGDHSLDLQSYLVGEYQHASWCEFDYDENDACNCTPTFIPGIVPPAKAGDIKLSPDVPKGEILPEVWKSLEVDVAQSIRDVAAKLGDVVSLMPGKQGEMVFKSMMTMNAKRPTIGDYRARIQHGRQKQNLVILDDSGSVNSATVQAIVDDCVALSYMANAHFACVSNSTRHWEPGTYDSAAILREAQYGGTHYETLESLLNEDWGVVVTIADYDSSPSAKQHIKAKCHGHIDQVLDISLVNRPSFLAECVGQIADEVRPLLVAKGSYVSTY